MEFINKKIYKSIDWDTEIANEPALENEEQAERLSESLMIWTYIEPVLSMKMNDKIIEKHEKANLMRTIEYLYCKFIYHHALFYKNKKVIDLKENEKEYKNSGIEHPVNAARKKLGKVIKSNLPLEELQKVEKAMSKHVMSEMKKNSPADGGFDEVKEMLEKEGLTVEKPIGLKKEGDRDTACIIHDGIRYHIYLMKSRTDDLRTQEKAHNEANDYKSLVEKYHPLIKNIHDELKKMDGMENLWVMEGGGAQHQAFFGNENGYIAILYLGSKNSNKVSKACTLVFESYEDEESWKKYKDFKVEGVECIAFDKTKNF